MKLNEAIENSGISHLEIISIVDSNNSELFTGNIGDISLKNKNLLDLEVVGKLEFINGFGCKVVVEAPKTFGQKTLQGLKRVGGFFADKAVEAKQKIDCSIENYKEEKELQKRIIEEFKNKAVKIYLVIPNEEKNKNRKISVFAIINREKGTIIYIKKYKKITLDCFFADASFQKYKIRYIDQKPSYSIRIDDTNYPIDCGIVEFKLENDEETVKQVTYMIDNSITINDSTITDSEINQNEK